MENIAELRNRASKEPSGENLYALGAKLVESEESRDEGRFWLMKSIEIEPSNLTARLKLARALYLDGLNEYAVRELIEIRRRDSELESVRRLLDAFGPYVDQFMVGDQEGVASSEQLPDGEEIAEFDLDLDFTEAISESDK